MGKCNVYIPEHLGRIAKRHSRDLLSAVEEDLMSLYTLLAVTGEEMKGYFTSREMLLLCEVFKNDGFESARTREWPALLAWDLEDVEKLELITPLQALWLLHTIRRCKDTGTGSHHTE